jgi:cytoskeleton protein RodZ
MSDGGSIPHQVSKIGRTLQLARRERGLSLKQVEEATKIRSSYLAELERENFDVLPAVYVQGSLKTYANFLHLDGEALVQELKRRQAPRQEPAYVEPSNDAPDLPTVPLGTAAVVDSPEATGDGEDAGSTLVPAGIGRYLYLGVGALLVLVVVILAFALAGDRPPAVSQVREPLISQAPPEAAPVARKEDERANLPNKQDKKQGAVDNPQTERSAKPPDVNTVAAVADQTAQTWQAQATSLPEQASRDMAATQSASPPAETAPATAEPETAAPQTTEPETASAPPAAEEPAQGNISSAPASAPANQSGGAPPPTSPRPRNGDDFDVRINAGGDDPVQIIGNPAN